VSYRMRVSCLVVAVAALSACVEATEIVAEEAMNTALSEVVGTEPLACEPRCGPPTECVPKEDGSGCYEIDEPEWREAWSLMDPPTDDVKPPPDCSVCSPLSRPTVPVSKTRPRMLPPFLLSDDCLIDFMQSRTVR
jgi:hypothetical protein